MLGHIDSAKLPLQLLAAFPAAGPGQLRGSLIGLVDGKRNGFLRQGSFASKKTSDGGWSHRMAMLS